MRKVLILGSTGSIGVQALEVVRASDELDVVGLSAATDVGQLIDQAREHEVGRVALADVHAAGKAGKLFDGEVLAGEEGVRELVAASRASWSGVSWSRRSPRRRGR